MISGERKKFGLRPARKPLLVDGLSNTVIVYEHGHAYYCYVNWSDDFPAAVGKQLARGLVLDDPVFLQVVFDQTRQQWQISACTLSTWAQQPLWTSAARPAWIKELKPIRPNHDSTETHRAARTAASGTRRDTIVATAG